MDTSYCLDFLGVGRRREQNDAQAEEFRVYRADMLLHGLPRFNRVTRLHRIHDPAMGKQRKTGTLTGLQTFITGWSDNLHQRCANLQHRAIVGGFGQRRMKSLISLRNTLFLPELLFLQPQNRLQPRQILRSRTLGGQGRYGRLDEQSQLKDVLEGQVMKRQGQILCVAARNKVPGATPADGKALQLHHTKRFSQRRPAFATVDPFQTGQTTFGRHYSGPSGHCPARFSEGFETFECKVGGWNCSSPSGRRWPEGPDEGAFPALTRRFARPSPKGRGTSSKQVSK